ncbi:hypothetical protein T439DRAFT_330280 [Meredithblackwellia eburnea MCA 4105]
MSSSEEKLPSSSLTPRLIPRDPRTQRGRYNSIDYSFFADTTAASPGSTSSSSPPTTSSPSPPTTHHRRHYSVDVSALSLNGPPVLPSRTSSLRRPLGGPHSAKAAGKQKASDEDHLAYVQGGPVLPPRRQGGSLRSPTLSSTLELAPDRDRGEGSSRGSHAGEASTEGLGLSIGGLGSGGLTPPGARQVRFTDGGGLEVPRAVEKVPSEVPTPATEGGSAEGFFDAPEEVPSEGWPPSPQPLTQRRRRVVTRARVIVETEVLEDDEHEKLPNGYSPTSYGFPPRAKPQFPTICSSPAASEAVITCTTQELDQGYAHLLHHKAVTLLTRDVSAMLNQLEGKVKESDPASTVVDIS